MVAARMVGPVIPAAAMVAVLAGDTRAVVPVTQTGAAIAQPTGATHSAVAGSANRRRPALRGANLSSKRK